MLLCDDNNEYEFRNEYKEPVDYQSYDEPEERQSNEDWTNKILEDW